MYTTRNQSLKQILIDTRSMWDHDCTRTEVRQNFLKIIACGTPALGANVYASETETLLVHHTCKSRFCPSCGYRASGFWREELEVTLPNISFVGINFTMPSVFWPIFQQNRRLLNDLSAIAASALQRWAETKHGVKVLLIVVPQTFGGMLNFNPHLHMLVSAGGLKKSQGRWIARMDFKKSEIMEMWRLALSSYLWLAVKNGTVKSQFTKDKLEGILTEQHKRDWVIYVSPLMSKARFLNYAGRYIRRSPVPLSKILEITEGGVRFEAKDTRGRRKVELVWPKQMFVEVLAQHVCDHYRHAMRYFGLLAPRCRWLLVAALFAPWKQSRRPRLRRLSWAESLQKDFGVNPLIDKKGHPLVWIRRQKATKTNEPVMAR